MCFSPETSYALGAILLSGGGVSLYKAIKISPRYIPMALMPLFVGIQQIGEGAVWTGLDTGCEPATRAGSFVFLFFAWVVWPFWIPFMTWFLEPDRDHRRILACFMAAGAVCGLSMYVPYIWHPEWVSAEINHNSISYVHHLWAQTYVSPVALYAIYLSIIGLAPVLSSHLHVKLFGIALIVATNIVYAFYTYAETSVLCFFAGAMTMLLIGIIWKDKCHLRVR
jgi:hypothetical protein